jgi:uncharacterized membrane protein YadS
MRVDRKHAMERISYLIIRTSLIIFGLSLSGDLILRQGLYIYYASTFGIIKSLLLCSFLNEYFHLKKIKFK